MAETTEISWCEHTWNPWQGCTRVSSACDNCYAETRARRFGMDFNRRQRTSTENWKLPLRWNRAAAAAGERRRVFSPSLGDPFDNQVPDEWRADFWDVIRECQHLDWMLLTKRPQNMVKMLPAGWLEGWPNVWLGTTVESVLTAGQRLPHLLATPAVLRFVSAEPLLEAVDLTHVPVRPGLHLNALTGYYSPAPTLGLKGYAEALRALPGITGARVDLVIVGGESGTRARPMQSWWAERLLRQAGEAGVAAHFKQVGSNRAGAGWPDTITGKGTDPAEWPPNFRVQQRPSPQGRL